MILELLIAGCTFGQVTEPVIAVQHSGPAPAYVVKDGVVYVPVADKDEENYGCPLLGRRKGFSQPIYYDKPNVTQPKTVYQDIINAGTPYDKFYVWVYLEKYDYKTQVPVINGYLPSIIVDKGNDGVYKLTLDYKSKHVYNHHGGNGSSNPIVYPDSRKKKAPNLDIKPINRVDNNHGKSAPNLDSEKISSPNSSNSKQKEIDELLDKLRDRDNKINSIQRELEDYRGKSGLSRPSSVAAPNNPSLGVPNYGKNN